MTIRVVTPTLMKKFGYWVEHLHMGANFDILMLLCGPAMSFLFTLETNTEKTFTITLSEKSTTVLDADKMLTSQLVNFQTQLVKWMQTAHRFFSQCLLLLATSQLTLGIYRKKSGIPEGQRYLIRSNCNLSSGLLQRFITWRILTSVGSFCILDLHIAIYFWCSPRSFWQMPVIRPVYTSMCPGRCE